MSSGGKSQVDIDDFDVFVVHGMFTFSELTARAQWKQYAENPAGYPGGAFPQSAADWLDPTPCGALLRELAPLDLPIVLSPAPQRLEKILADPDPEFAAEFTAMLDAQGAPVPVIAQSLKYWHTLLSTAPFIGQPEDTLDVSGAFTRVCFQTGVEFIEPRFVAHYIGAEDYSHMNDVYGAKVLERMINACQGEIATHKKRKDSETRRRKSASAVMQPYADLPNAAFWKRTVSGRTPEQIGEWYRKKFDLGSAAIATAGSCFAQHIGHYLRRSGFCYVDTEPAPATIPLHQHADYGYGLCSARYGNVYTARQLLQLFDRAFGNFAPVEDGWQRDGGFVDPFRPGVMPVPCDSREALVDDRTRHLAAVREVFSVADVFVFTLGLTEAWVSCTDGAVFPVAPGVNGGQYDSERYRFVNFKFQDVYDDLSAFIGRVRHIRPRMRFLLTVSPVPLMATASGKQVVAATTYSKSVLRAVAGQLADEHDFVDYFPSYEIICASPMEGRFFQEDKRSVTPAGVRFVMEQFFAEHVPPAQDAGMTADDSEDVHCDEEVLAAFGRPESGSGKPGNAS